ncbi:hypothetical protein FRB96_003480 [Tulasnella sp. 330]|nr:hypothetical protein FRB96_003480 [Tulasnella sp. 330]
MPLPDERPRANVANLIGRWEKAKPPASGSEGGNSTSNSPLVRPLVVRSNAGSPAFLGLGSAASSPVKDRPVFGNGWRTRSPLEPSPLENRSDGSAAAVSPMNEASAKQEEVVPKEPESITAPPEVPVPVVPAAAVETSAPPPPPPVEVDPPSSSTDKEATSETITLNSPLNNADLTAKPARASAVQKSTPVISSTRAAAKPSAASRGPPPTASASSLSQSVVNRAMKPSPTKSISSSTSASGSTRTINRARSSPHLKKDQRSSSAKSPPPPPMAPVLRPQHTGNSVASTTTGSRRYQIPPPPPVPSSTETPKRAKTPSLRSKTPTTTGTPRAKVPSSGSSSALFAPTASSLAKLKAAAEVKANGNIPSSTPSKPTIPSSSSSRLMAPTAASLARMGATKPMASPLSTPQRSVAPPSSSRKPLITAAKAVPGSNGVAAIKSKGSTPAVTNGGAYEPENASSQGVDLGDDLHVPVELIQQQSIVDTPGESQQLEDDDEAGKQVLETPRVDIVPATPYEEAFADDEAEAPTPSPSADPNSMSKGSEAEYFGDGIHVPPASGHLGKIQHDHLEHMVAMLEGSAISYLAGVEPPSGEVRPVTSKPEQLQVEKEQETGGYEDDVEGEIPDIPDHEY